MRLAIRVITLALLIGSGIWTRPVLGQAVVDALEVTRPGILGYTTNGVGWSFVPSTDVEVTAVYSSSPQISFWHGSNQLLVTYEYTGPSGSIPTGPSTNFQGVAPILLSGGQTYFVSAQTSNFASQVNFTRFGGYGQTMNLVILQLPKDCETSRTF